MTERDPNDGTAAELLKHIREEKTRLVNERKLAKLEVLLPVEEDESTEKLPDGWARARLGDICLTVIDMNHKMPETLDKGVKFISAKDLLDDGTINFEHNIKRISEKDFAELSKRILPQRGDIIYSRIGARLGKARTVETDERFMVSYSCCVVRPFIVDARYINYHLDSEIVMKQARDHTKSIGVPDLGLKDIKHFIINVPPLVEQRRIVATIESLFAQADAIERAVAIAQHRADKIDQSILARAFRGEL